MSESDYQRGIQGLARSPGMDGTDYEAGKSVYDAKQRILGAGYERDTTTGPRLSRRATQRSQRLPPLTVG
jgi:hypothetical protein